MVAATARSSPASSGSTASAASADRRVGRVRDRDRRPSLAARLVDHGPHVGRLARLRDPDHERAVEPRRLLVERVERRRGERDGDAVRPAEQVLGVAGGIRGAAARGDQEVADIAAAEERAELAGRSRPAARAGAPAPRAARGARARAGNESRGPRSGRAEQAVGQRLVAHPAAAERREIAAGAVPGARAARRSRRRPRRAPGCRVVASRIQAWRCASRTTITSGRRPRRSTARRSRRSTRRARSRCPAAARRSPSRASARPRPRRCSPAAAARPRAAGDRARLSVGPSARRATTRPASRSIARRRRRRRGPRRSGRPARPPRAAAPRRAHPPRPLDERALHRVDRLLAEVVADQERVDPRRERQHRASLDADVVADRLHLERVGDHEPVVAELVAEQARDDRRAEGGRQRRRAPARGCARS